MKRTPLARMSPFFHIREAAYSAELKGGGIAIKTKKSTDNTFFMKTALFSGAIQKTIRQMNLQWHFPTFKVVWRDSESGSWPADRTEEHHTTTRGCNRFK